jgi:pyrimidine operon attenuation protein/uracil phosphoribosyltransferase
MDSDSVNRTISRIVNQILERNNGARDLAIIGIRTRGVYIAGRIAAEIERIEGIKPPLGTLDITSTETTSGTRPNGRRLKKQRYRSRWKTRR